MIRQWLFRRWRMVSIIVFLVCTAVYVSAFQIFDVSIFMEKPNKNNPPLFPSAKDAAGKFSNQAIREHSDALQNITEKLKTDVAVQRSEKEDSDVRVVKKNDIVEDFMSTWSEINRLRRETIIEKCSNHPELNKGGMTDNTYRHIYVNAKHKLLYCFIPKVGCSNWKKVMMILGGSTKKISEISPNEVHVANGMKLLAEFSPEERQQKLQTYKKFVYSRNPFARLLSAFNDKYGNIDHYRKGTYFQGFAKMIMRKFRHNATARELKTGENITWTEFVKFLTQPHRPFFDDHWEEMFKICSPCKIRYDYVGRLETVSEDAKYMLKELQLDSFVEFPSKCSHATNSTAKFEKAFQDLPRDKSQKLWKIYEKDFELFDYPKPDFIAEL